MVETMSLKRRSLASPSCPLGSTERHHIPPRASRMLLRAIPSEFCGRRSLAVTHSLDGLAFVIVIRESRACGFGAKPVHVATRRRQTHAVAHELVELREGLDGDYCLSRAVFFNKVSPQEFLRCDGRTHWARLHADFCVEGILLLHLLLTGGIIDVLPGVFR